MAERQNQLVKSPFWLVDCILTRVTGNFEQGAKSYTPHKYLPFKDLMYDCQNLAFLFGVSFMPIIARWFLNILGLCSSRVFRSLKGKMNKNKSNKCTR